MITIKEFGANSKGRVAAVTLTNHHGMSVTVLSYGATVQSIRVPDRNGTLNDVVLGYETAAEYERNDGYLGATIGRNANRIAGAAFTLDHVRYALTANEGRNQLHGGNNGLDKKIWSYSCRANTAEFTTVLADGEEGFPGCMAISVCFSLDEDNGLRIDYLAEADADTIANFTNHTYFNLNGQGSGTIWEHSLRLAAGHYTPGDEQTMPTGEILPVDGTCMDFREAKPIGRDRDDAALALYGGYDHNFCLDGEGLRCVADAVGDRSGIRMEVETTLEGIQLYTGKYLTHRAGKAGAAYEPHFGFCLETQHYPDAINQPAFPSPVLRRGGAYHETTVYRFGLEGKTV